MIAHFLGENSVASHIPIGEDEISETCFAHVVKDEKVTVLSGQSSLFDFI